MCGIGGMFVGNDKVLGTEGSKVAASLILSLQDRGTHAVGYMTDGDVRLTHKYGMSASKLLSKVKRLNGLVKNTFENDKILMHTRYATHGSADKNKNNHPFVVGDLVMAHNGVFPNHEYFLQEYGIETDIETDSYAIIAAIEQVFQMREATEEGTREDNLIASIQEIAGQTRGFACWLYDKVSKNTYIFRNGVGSPLSYFHTDDMAIFASTQTIITGALDVYGLDVKAMDEADIEEGVIYKIADGETKPVIREYFSKITFTEVAKYEIAEEEQEEEPEVDLCLPPAGVKVDDPLLRHDMTTLNYALISLGFSTDLIGDNEGLFLQIHPILNSEGNMPYEVFGTGMNEHMFLYDDGDITRVVNAINDFYKDEPTILMMFESFLEMRDGF